MLVNIDQQKKVMNNYKYLKIYILKFKFDYHFFIHFRPFPSDKKIETKSSFEPLKSRGGGTKTLVVRPQKKLFFVSSLILDSWHALSTGSWLGCQQRLPCSLKGEFMFFYIGVKFVMEK